MVRAVSLFKLYPDSIRYLAGDTQFSIYVSSLGLSRIQFGGRLLTEF